MEDRLKIKHQLRSIKFNDLHFIEAAIETRSTASQPAIICSKLTIETLEQGVKYVQS